MATKAGRPVGTGKSPSDKFVLKSFKFPPELWEKFCDAVPKDKRASTIRKLMMEFLGMPADYMLNYQWRLG